jgi:integrase
MKQTSSSPSAKNKFVPVFDAQGRRIPRLLQRNNRFYLQKRNPNDSSEPPKKYPLESSTIRDARIEAEGVNAKIERGEYEPATPPTPIRKVVETQSVKPSEFGETAEKYLSNCESQGIRPNTIRCYKDELGSWRDGFSEAKVKSLHQITPRNVALVVDAWRDETKRAEIRISNYRIKKRLATLHRMLEWATDRELLPLIPFDRKFVKKLAGKVEAKQKRRFLKEAEVSRLIEEAREMNGRSLGSMLGDLIELMAYSGLREQEAFTLRWRAVDFDEQSLKVEDEKCPQDGEIRSVPFNKRLQNLLTRLRKEAKARGEDDKEEFIFKTNYTFKDKNGRVIEDDRPVKNLRRLLYKACQKAGLEEFADDPRRKNLHTQTNLGFHDLRRFFITMCLNKSVPANIIAKWVGHKDGGMLIMKTYVRHDEELGRKLAAKLDF